jgi:hypothetical protein
MMDFAIQQRENNAAESFRLVQEALNSMGVEMSAHQRQLFEWMSMPATYPAFFTEATNERIEAHTPDRRRDRSVEIEMQEDGQIVQVVPTMFRNLTRPLPAIVTNGQDIFVEPPQVEPYRAPPQSPHESDMDDDEYISLLEDLPELLEIDEREEFHNRQFATTRPVQSPIIVQVLDVNSNRYCAPAV